MNDEVKILYQQLITSGLYILVFIAFIFLTYNNILRKTGRPYYFNDEDAKFIILFVNIIAFLLLLSYLYVNYKLYENDKNFSNKLQFIVSIFSIIGSIVIIYSIIISNNVGGLFNPEI